MTLQITLEVDAISFSKITAIDARAGRRRTDLVEVRRGEPAIASTAQSSWTRPQQLPVKRHQTVLPYACIVTVTPQGNKNHELIQQKNNASFHRRVLFSYCGVKQVHFFQNLSERM